MLIEGPLRRYFLLHHDRRCQENDFGMRKITSELKPNAFCSTPIRLLGRFADCGMIFQSWRHIVFPQQAILDKREHVLWA